MSDAYAITETELRSLAHYALARQAGDSEDWLVWEDYPMLGEYDFERLVGFVESVGQHLAKLATVDGVDPVFVMEHVR